MGKSIFLAILALFYFGVQNIYAAPPPRDIEFEINFSNVVLPDGDWRLSLVDVNKYEDIKTGLNKEKHSYIISKKLCNDDAYLDIYRKDLSDERIKQGVMRYCGDAFHVVINNKKYNECGYFYGYEDVDICDIEEGQSNLPTTFYGYLAGNKLRETREFVRTCKFENKMCAISGQAEERLKGQYFIVLENKNSKDAVYFSNSVNINWTAYEKDRWRSSVIIDVIDFEISKNNELKISFKQSDSLDEDIEKKEQKLGVFFGIIGMLLVIFLLTILRIIKLKNKRT